MTIFWSIVILVVYTWGVGKIGSFFGYERGYDVGRTRAEAVCKAKESTDKVAKKTKAPAKTSKKSTAKKTTKKTAGKKTTAKSGK